MSEASRPRHSAALGRRGQAGDAIESTVAGPVEPTDVSRYIAEICVELSGMAKAAELDMLTYLLGMARQEADRIAKAGSNTP